MLFSELCEQYEKLILPMHKPATQNTVRSHISVFSKYVPEDDIKAFTFVYLQTLFNGISRNNVSPKTLHNLWGTLRQLLSFAKDQGLITEVPKVKLPKIPRSEPDCLSPEQMTALIDNPYRAQWRPFFAVLSETGLRIGEVLGLKIKDINLETRQLRVSRSVYNGSEQTPKTNASFRTISISTGLRNIIQKSLWFSDATPEAFLFADGLGNPWRIGYAYKVLREAAEIKGIKVKGFHAFRRGNATIMGKLGIPEKIAATRMGHTLPGLTFGLYAQSVEGADREAAEIIAKELGLDKN